MELVPLDSFIYLVQESIEVNTDLGGFRITWENIQSKTVYVFVHINNGTEEEIRILSSNNSSESIAVRGLPSEEITISTRIEDFDENSTTLEEKGTLTPLFEQVIDKSTWTLVASQSVNGNAWEGASANFWDDDFIIAMILVSSPVFIYWARVFIKAGD